MWGGNVGSHHAFAGRNFARIAMCHTRDATARALRRWRLKQQHCANMPHGHATTVRKQLLHNLCAPLMAIMGNTLDCMAARRTKTALLLLVEAVAAPSCSSFNATEEGRT